MLEKEPNDVLVDAPEPVDGGFNAEAVALLRDIRDELKNRPL